jgi:ATP synthase mitochondrial F1 complex assembly factor 2
MTCTAMERATHTTKSFIVALALVKRHLTVEEASLAAQVEVASQIQRWGEVEDCKLSSAKFLILPTT